ncbi:uncharacterized protein LOC110973409 [Acanthaster planci]|uniref:Uncharacterized protein LOC110973409 n=1 Tax=Acanthaster planci TaxID=133434 RepID=A0A8B7XGL4_ACAPL|nr:uncharacterized protein LOC110973409 [Acanthaster planci]
MPKSNRNCAVGGCSHTQKTCPKGRFVGFPNEEKQPERRALWVKLVQRGSQWVPTKNSRVCGCHFCGGYKVDDPNDPAYNPSIFPPAPELDRRVRKTMMEEMYRQKAQEVQAIVDHPPPLPLPTNQRHENDDLMKYVSAALDLSKEAGEEYAQAVKAEKDALKSNHERINGPLTSTDGAQEADCHQLTSANQESPSRVKTASGVTTSDELDGNCQFISGGQLSAQDELVKDGSLSVDSTHGWLYIKQSRTLGSAVNAACGSHEPGFRKRRLLHASHKPQGPMRLQKSVPTSRKSSGNLSVAKHPRNVQIRHFTRAVGSVDLNRARALNASASPLEQNATTGTQPHNCILSNLLTMHQSKETQTVLSVASLADWNTSSLQTRGRCFGFHGWNDICFSETTVRRVTGVTPEVFDLLLDQLPEVMPGLPSHNCLLLFLMKLKMNVPFEFLATVFGITAPTASNIFSHVLATLVGLLSDLVRWPSGSLEDSLPQESHWRRIPGLRVVIDFLIIQTEWPSPEHQPEMLSKEEGTGAVKILVGLYPNGSIGAVSNAFTCCTTVSDGLANLRLPDFCEKDSRVLLLQQDKHLYRVLRSKGFSVLSPPYTSCTIPWQEDPSSDILTHPHSKGVPRPCNSISTKLSELCEMTEAAAQSDLMELSVPDGSIGNGFLGSVDGLQESVDGLPEPGAPSSTPEPAFCPKSEHTPDTVAFRAYARRMAQRLRSFSILTSMFESSLLPHIDDVVAVCAALNNLQDPLS